MLDTIEGTLNAANARWAIVASRFNHFIVDRLVDGAVDALRRHGADKSSITLIKTPGSFELPLAVQRACDSKRFDGVIACGCVIRGATPHFEYVSSEVTKGCATAMMASGLPVSFGVLTTDSIEQAIERAGTKAGNKGWEAAMAAIEMVNMLRTFDTTN